MTRRLCLVTGASSGIGEAFAREYARWGYDLCLTARRETRLQALAEELRAKYGASCLVAPADLADPEAVDQVLQRIGAGGRPVDALVNNAGFGLTGRYDETEWTAQRASLQVMLVAVAELTHKLLPGMMERRFGRIINVASIAGLMPGSAGYTLYGPIKSFVLRMSQSLHVEAAPAGVHVTAVCPGLTRSEFFETSDTAEAVSKLPGFMWSTSDEVAQAGYQACEANRVVVAPGAPNKAAAALAHLLPDQIAMSVMARFNPRSRKA